MSTIAHHAEPITEQGYRRLLAERDELLSAKPLRTVERVASERRICELNTILAVVSVVDPPPDGDAGIGNSVLIRFDGDTEPTEFELVGAVESDPRNDRFSIDSPIGRAVAGRRAGDIVDVQTPGGTRTVEILAVTRSVP